MEIYKSRSDEPLVDWQWHEPSLRNITHLILKRVPGGGGRALDVGCGTGRVTFALAERGWDVTGVDIEPRVIEIASRLARSRTDPPRFHVADLGDVEAVEQDGYDLVVCSEVLEHVVDDAALAATLYRALRPGGRVIVTVPYDPRKWSVLDEYGGHVRRYTAPQIARTLGQFDDLRIYITGFPFYRLLLRAYLAKASLLGQEHSNEALWEKPSTRLIARALYPFMRLDNLLAFTRLGDALIVTAEKPLTSP